MCVIPWDTGPGGVVDKVIASRIICSTLINEAVLDTDILVIDKEFMQLWTKI